MAEVADYDKKPDDFCAHGHSPYCEHRDQTPPRCQATYIARPDCPVRCNEVDGHGGDGRDYFHEGPVAGQEGVRYRFSERDAVYPAASPDRVKLGGKRESGARLEQAIAELEGIKAETLKFSGGPSARDSQVGGDHYRKHKIQVWDIVDEYDLGHYRAAAIKYLLRAGDKGPAVEDLKKAIHYIQKCIEREEGK
jgi:hypothetical protein